MGRGRKPRRLGKGNLILPSIRRLRPFLGGSNFEFQYFGGLQKDEYFLGGWGGGWDGV